MRYQMNKTKGLLLTAGIVLAMTFTFSCSGDDGGGEEEGGQKGIIQGTPVTYEGETYPTVIIGSQTWFAKNLNYNASGSKCYGGDPANCTIYGRLYDWETAKTACPSDWHLPSQAEWDTLSNYVKSNGGDCNVCDAKLLKATSGWAYNEYLEAYGNGTDQYGFSALPGGYGSSGGSGDYFFNVGDYGYWWSADEYSSARAWFLEMYYMWTYARWEYDYKSVLLYSVRCIKD